MVDRGSFISRCFVDWLVGIVAWGSFVCYFDNISRVTISSVVFYNLGSAIWKSNSVLTVGRVSITGFVLSEVSPGILICNGVLVFVLCRLVISRFVVSWFVGGRLVGCSRFVYWSSMVGGTVIYWSWVKYCSRLVGMMSWSVSYSMAVPIRVTMLNSGMASHVGVGNSQ